MLEEGKTKLEKKKMMKKKETKDFFKKPK